MLIDALVPIDCRAASFRHLPSRRRATIIPITRPPLLTLIDAPFSPGLSRYRSGSCTTSSRSAYIRRRPASFT
mgnify:CR=1 FL=1